MKLSIAIAFYILTIKLIHFYFAYLNLNFSILKHIHSARSEMQPTKWSYNNYSSYPMVPYNVFLPPIIIVIGPYMFTNGG